MRVRNSAIRLHNIHSTASLYNAYAFKNKTFYFPIVSIGRIIIMCFHVSKKFKHSTHVFSSLQLRPGRRLRVSVYGPLQLRRAL